MTSVRLVDDLFQHPHQGVHVPQVHVAAHGGRHESLRALRQDSPHIVAQKHLPRLLGAQSAAPTSR